MGNGGLTGCTVMDQEAVSVVHPNGYVEYIRKPCNVGELLQGYPDYFLSRSIIAKSRGLPRHAKLETGQTYFLQPKPRKNPGTRILRQIHDPEHAPVRLTLLQALGVDNQCSTGGDRKRRTSVHASYPTSKKGVSEYHVKTEILEPGRKLKESAREIEVKQGAERQIRHHNHAGHPSVPSYIRTPECLVKFVFFQGCCSATSRLSNDHVRLLEPQLENRAKSRMKQDSHPYSRGSRYKRSGNKSWRPVLQSISEATPVILESAECRQW